MSESSASALVRRFTEDVWNGRQLDLLDDLADDAYQLRNLRDDSVPVHTRAELRTHIEEGSRRFPIFTCRRGKATSSSVAQPLSERFEDALLFSARTHRFQTRKSSGIPYLGHLLGVC